MPAPTFLIFETELINLDHIYEIDIGGNDEDGYQAQFFYVVKDTIESKSGKIFKTVNEVVASLRATGVDLKRVEMEPPAQ